MGIPTIVVYLGFIGDSGIRDAGEPFQDPSHWSEVLSEYAKAAGATDLFERRLECDKAPFWLLSRTRAILETSPPPSRQVI